MFRNELHRLFSTWDIAVRLLLSVDCFSLSHRFHSAPMPRQTFRAVLALFIPNDCKLSWVMHCITLVVFGFFFGGPAFRALSYPVITHCHTHSDCIFFYSGTW